MTNDTFIGGNSGSPTLLYVNNATNLLANDLTMSGSNYFSINVNDASGIVENSTINSSVGTTGIQIAGISGGGTTLIAQGNTVYGQIAGNAEGSAIYVSADAEAINNVVYNSNLAITVISGIADNNQVYGSATGILRRGKRHGGRQHGP